MISLLLIIFLIYYFYILNIKIYNPNNNDIYILNLPNGNLKYIYLKNKNLKNTKVILYCQGYLETIYYNYGVNKINLLKKLFSKHKGYDIISYNYNKDSNIIKDSIYFIQFIISNNGLNINPNNLILFGKSIGAGVVLNINTFLYKNNLRPYKIILEAPYINYPAISYNNLANYNFLDQLQYINSNILILYGKKDFFSNYNIIKLIINKLLLLNKKKYVNYLILNNHGHNNIFKNNYSKLILKQFLE